MSMNVALMARPRAGARALPALSVETVVRVVLGAYLVLHFATLLPYASELFSNRGMLPEASLSPLSRAFPNVLAHWDSPVVVRALLVGGIVGALALALGVQRRAAALFVLYTWACLLGRNPLIRNPSIPFVGLMLATFAMEPTGDTPDSKRVRATLRSAFLLVLSVAYSYSATTKLSSPSWIDGSAFHALLENPLARDGLLRPLILAMPAWPFAAATYGVVALELLYAPLSLFPRLRLPLSVAMIGMHVGLIVLVDFADLSFAMILAHFFTLQVAAAPWRQEGAT